jgi:hypothetical protein
VLDALAGSRGAIELNADPHRLDLPPAWIPAARERNIPFVVSVDAHSTRASTCFDTALSWRAAVDYVAPRCSIPRMRSAFAALVRPSAAVRRAERLTRSCAASGYLGASFAHLAEQPSPEMALPSSQFSFLLSMWPSPQRGPSVQSGWQPP